jgi:ferredoxin--NADP+ reductase
VTISVAIVGSGPSAFYTAEALAKSGADVRVDMIERLPAPFGLIRYGVAPDHESTRRVSRAFDKTARSSGLKFFGNVEVGRDMSLDDLRGMYDAVVLAVGAPLDRPLGIPGSDKKGVYGSAAFVGWYNGHPDFRGLNPDLKVKAAAVVGIGNVALDVARLLVRSRQELSETDMPDYAIEAFAGSDVADVHLLGRRGPAEAAFTIGELREMGELALASPVVDPAQLPASLDHLSENDRRVQGKLVELLRTFPGLPQDKPKRVHFRFFAAPKEVLGGGRVTGLRVERTRVEGSRAVGTGEFHDIPCGLVVAAIGYRSPKIAGGGFDDAKGLYPNQDGRIAPGLYAVGWAMRGPSGVIGTNKIDGQAVAAHIVQDLKSGAKPGRPALEAALAQRSAPVTGYDDWLRLDAEEVKRARPKAPRGKFTSVPEMLAFLNKG